MSSKSTPGPWAVGPMHDTVRPDGFDRIGVANDGFIICTVYGKTERAGNARMIAAAPAMKRALQRQVDNIERWLDTGEPAGQEESKAIYEQLKAALRQAS